MSFPTQNALAPHCADACTESNWTRDEVAALFELPFNDLIHRAHTVHRTFHDPNTVQLSTLLSIKTGGCPEDCGYCPQSARYPAGVVDEQLLGLEEVLVAARAAKEMGATRFCMGAAWRGAREGTAQFAQVLAIVRAVAALDIEVCVTLGQLSPAAAQELKRAGLHTYNHNLDTSPEFYPKIVTTHGFADRLNTIRAVQAAGLSLCCGGIIGLGESPEDRLRMLAVLTAFDPPPESVPINCLMPMPGTPMAEQPPVDSFELVRLIATTRIALPKSKVRLSAGRTLLSREGQALCFFAGANSLSPSVSAASTTARSPANTQIVFVSSCFTPPKPPSPNPADRMRSSLAASC